MVLLENGSLLATGANYDGQLGDGTTLDRNQSVEIFSSDINQVATGIGHTMILKTDGSLWTVSSNLFGQLGTGQSGGGNNSFDEGIDEKTPVQVVASGVSKLVNLQANSAPVIAQGTGPITFTIPEDAGVVSWAAWDRTFGGSGKDVCNDVIATADGGYLLVGESNSTATGDKSDAGRGGMDYWAGQRSTHWVTRSGTSATVAAGTTNVTVSLRLLMAVTFLAGESNSTNDGDKSQPSQGKEDYWIVKIDANGSKLWDPRSVVAI